MFLNGFEGKLAFPKVSWYHTTHSGHGKSPNLQFRNHSSTKPCLQGQGTRDQGPGTRDQGPGKRDQGQGTRDKGPGPGTRDKGPGPRDKGPGPGTGGYPRPWSQNRVLVWAQPIFWAQAQNWVHILGQGQIWAPGTKKWVPGQEMGPGDQNPKRCGPKNHAELRLQN